jgi:hypothetical protein
VADFSRTTSEHLDEHLLALISGGTQQRDTDYQQNQLFAGVTNGDLISKSEESGSGEALDIFFRPRSAHLSAAPQIFNSPKVAGRLPHLWRRYLEGQQTSNAPPELHDL